jgi:signal peptidase II
VKVLGVKIWGSIFFILLIDQSLKLWIKTNFYVGESVEVFSWFFIYFVENNGFAFGIELFGKFGKLLLTFIRLFFVFFLFRWLINLVKKEVSGWGLFSFVLIIAGALGNIVDSVFYGVLFDYAPLFYGRVVDMFYFPLISGTYPDWLPFVGGRDFVFFRYIFNIADSSITIGAVLLLFFHKKIPVK